MKQLMNYSDFKHFPKAKEWLIEDFIEPLEKGGLFKFIGHTQIQERGIQYLHDGHILLFEFLGTEFDHFPEEKITEVFNTQRNQKGYNKVFPTYIRKHNSLLIII